ncbi:MAG: RNA polymerase sigma factor [Nitrospirales bacterium]|nr:MAG: RNA polymerase sigma factor [Nitrospirales bacterium]
MNLTYQDIEQLYHHHKSELIRRLLRIVRCDQTAIDLAQETYLRLVNLAKTTTVSFPRAFLYRTATNLAIDHLRKQSYRQHLPLEAAEDLPTDTPSGDQHLAYKERMVTYQHALATLTPRCRQAFLLHRLHQCSYREIGNRLHISQGAVEKLMVRALAHIRTELHRHDTP